MSFVQGEEIGPTKPETQEAERPDRRLAQPFSGWNHSRMSASIDAFIREGELDDYAHYIRRGAFLAQSKNAFAVGHGRRDGLTLKDSERRYLDLENSPRRIDKFKQPWRLFALVGLCSLGAAVQGWYVIFDLLFPAHADPKRGRDGGQWRYVKPFGLRATTHVITAQVYYTDALGLRGKDGWLGLVNSAPYLCCAFSCWSVFLKLFITTLLTQIKG